MDPLTTYQSERAPGGFESLWSEDPFRPYMPEVDVLPDSAAPFVIARAEVERGGPEKNLEEGQRCIGIVTPGRQVIFVPAPKPGRVTAGEVLQSRSLIPCDRPLNVTAVAFTGLQPLMQDISRCIPFLPQLLALAHSGHNVIVFEGHESALEYALRGTQALLIDSGMMPFLRRNWWETAMRAIRDRTRILVYDRKSGSVRPVRPE